MERFPRSIQERRVLIDTSAFLALTARNDANHRQARRIADQLSERQYYLYTTKFVIVEAHARIMSSESADAARIFLRAMQRTQIRLCRVRQVDEERAREIIFVYRDKDYSLCDAISFAVMERLQTGMAFTFDQHFRQHGFSIPLGQPEWP